MSQFESKEATPAQSRPVVKGNILVPMNPMWNHLDLTRLLEKCRKQDSRAWSQLVDRFQALVYSIARRHGLNSDDAEDVFLVTFQNLLRSIDRIESAAALPRWIAVSASRECLRINRIAGRNPDLESAGITLDEIVSSEESQAEDAAIEADQSRRLREALEMMDPRCRTLLQLLYFDEESSYADVGQALNMPVGAIGPTRSRCLEKLRGMLTKENFFDN